MERVGNHGRGKDVINADLEMELSVRVEQTVGMVLRCHGGQLSGGGAVVRHVGPRHHGVEPREGNAVKTLPLLVRGTPQRVGCIRTVDVGHLLDAAHQHHVGKPRRDLGDACAQRQAAGSTGGFDTSGGNTGHAQLVGEQGGEVLLTYEQPRRHASDRDVVHRVDAGVLESGQGGPRPYRAQGLLPQLAALDHPDSDDRYLPHTALLLAHPDLAAELRVGAVVHVDLVVVELHSGNRRYVLDLADPLGDAEDE